MKIKKLIFTSLICLLSIVMCASSLRAETFTVKEVKDRILKFCDRNDSQYFMNKSIVFANIRDDFELGEYDDALRESVLWTEREYRDKIFPRVKDEVIRALINEVTRLTFDYTVFALRAHETAFIAGAENHDELSKNLTSLVDAYLELGQ